MLKPKSNKIPKPTRYQNAAIDYYMGLTNYSYLHYGYWEPLLHALGRLAFKCWLEKPITEGLAARAIFESHLRYEIQLWQLSQGV
ncbi:hypothetical protein [Nostoc sp.]|uniref:hypothetical protein n=1 Tax=Nostoc sp. TaxID=1180 RepID=UPI002FF7FEE4